MGDTTEYYFECNLHLAIIHFDEIVGPNLLKIYPDEQLDFDEKIKGVLQKLMDLGSYQEQQEWQFMYSDSSFSSLNMFLTLTNSDARGNKTDFMISLIILPTYPQIVSAMALDWNSLFELKTKCLNLLSEGMSLSNFNRITDQLTFILGLSFDTIKENIIFNLEILAPQSFKIS